MSEPTRKNSIEKSIEEFADVTVELLRGDYHSSLEPFEAYSARIKLELVNQMETYQERLLKGYEVLLRELAQPKKSDTNPQQKV
ncbi:MAG: hypothetical protein Q8K75_02940 [Chlamydiales bacterium]|nr:hypothetical protein [Chlamydiales bacterium]